MPTEISFTYRGTSYKERTSVPTGGPSLPTKGPPIPTEGLQCPQRAHNTYRAPLMIQRGFLYLLIQRGLLYPYGHIIPPIPKGPPIPKRWASYTNRRAYIT